MNYCSMLCNAEVAIANLPLIESAMVPAVRTYYVTAFRYVENQILIESNLSVPVVGSMNGTIIDIQTHRTASNGL